MPRWSLARSLWLLVLLFSLIHSFHITSRLTKHVPRTIARHDVKLLRKALPPWTQDVILDVAKIKDVVTNTIPRITMPTWLLDNRNRFVAAGAAMSVAQAFSRSTKFRQAAKTANIMIATMKFFTEFVKYKMVSRSKEDLSARQEKLAELLKHTLVSLGPTFIKVGQLLSTRVDLFPRPFIDSMKQLQDQVPSFDGDIAVKAIEREFNAPIDSIFEEFNRTPLASASLGQVHVAKLNGSLVAVKVQRPDLMHTVANDLKIMKVLTRLINMFDTKVGGIKKDWDQIYDEYSRILNEEIDYVKEAHNLMRFRENFRNTPWIRVPKVYLNRTTKSVITMEYISSVKINDIASLQYHGIDREMLSRRVSESYLTQLFTHGFIHCDPHPGNLACDLEGRLVYYDFGMMSEISSTIREAMIAFIKAVFDNDVTQTIDALSRMGIIAPDTDLHSLHRIGEAFLEEFSKGLISGVWVNQLSEKEQRRVWNERLAKFREDIYCLENDIPFRFPAIFTFIGRALSTIEGIGKMLNTRYDLIRIAQPFVRSIIVDQSIPNMVLKSIEGTVSGSTESFNNAMQQPNRVAQIFDTVKRLERGDLRLRVRVLESERSFQKIEAIQLMTLFSGFVFGSTSLGIQLLSRSKILALTSFSIAIMAAMYAIPFAFRYRDLIRFEASKVVIHGL